MKNNKLFIVVGILFLILAFAGIKQTFQEGTGTLPSVKIIQGNWDISRQVKEQGLERYLIEEVDFDYSHPGIQQLAKNIKSTTSSPYDAAKFTAKYVYDTTQYSSDITVSQCYQGTASSALKTKVGDCVDMTRMNVALLRAMGIPARSVGGCLKSSQRCTPLFAVYPDLEAQVTPMTEEDFKKRGFLHEWLEFWTPERGWQILEATSGQIFQQDCNAYIKFAYDTNQYDRCVITQASFWELCKAS